MPTLLIQLILTLVGLLSIIKVSRFYRKRKRLTDAMSKLPGPPQLLVPLVANAKTVLLYELAASLKQFDNMVLMYQEALATCRLFNEAGMYHFYVAHTPVVVLYSPENIEPLMTRTSGVLNKSQFYWIFEPWIGEGLITSKTDKWRTRRKIITPAFHFRILNDFMPIINAEATKLVHKLTDSKYEQSFDVGPVIAMCTLDTICETAMGVNINCQANEDLAYVRALGDVGKYSLARLSRPWLWPDAIFHRTRMGKKYVEARDLTHDFTMGVILKRKAEWEQVLASSSNLNGAGSDVGEQQSSSKMTFDNYLDSRSYKESRMRLAFLDLLLHQHLVNNNLTLDGIREEVDTFMFAGHDTTATSISWTIYMLGLNQDIQERVFLELNDIFGPNPDEHSGDEDVCADERWSVAQTGPDGDEMKPKLKTTNVTSEHLTKMKYLEMVIKESLRMWPSVPFVARQITEDIVVGDGKYLLPSGCTCAVHIHALHNNPEYYPRPEVFDPDRFSPENTLKRHPFAYVPFSAGPRNCIGQKYAMLEMKIILAKVILNYWIESTMQLDKLRVVGELVLKSTTGWPVRLVARHKIK